MSSLGQVHDQKEDFSHKGLRPNIYFKRHKQEPEEYAHVFGNYLDDIKEQLGTNFEYVRIYCRRDSKNILVYLLNVYLSQFPSINSISIPIAILFRLYTNKCIIQ